MKKAKLKLEELEVKSFITDLKQNESETVNGGALQNIKQVEIKAGVFGCTWLIGTSCDHTGEFDCASLVPQYCSITCICPDYTTDY